MSESADASWLNEVEAYANGAADQDTLFIIELSDLKVALGISAMLCGFVVMAFAAVTAGRKLTRMLRRPRATT